MNGARMLAALQTPGLTVIQQLVYVLIVGWADGDHCRTTVQAIADHLNRSTQRSTVYRAVEALTKLGLIASEKVAHGVFRYRILDTTTSGVRL
jgi:predicted transcriptional regulator